MHYTSVLFDLDGTLLDTLGDLTAAMNRTLTRHGLPERTRQQMRTALGNGARRLMELSVPSGTDSALFETLLAEYNADYAAHCRIETAPYPGVAALLRTTDLMIFHVPYVIAELSQGMTLRPGTIISMGTPAGVGMGFDPPKWLHPGDVVACSIEGIGTLTNTVR